MIPNRLFLLKVSTPVLINKYSKNIMIQKPNTKIRISLGISLIKKEKKIITA
jgi:hypothetical protein